MSHITSGISANDSIPCDSTQNSFISSSLSQSSVILEQLRVVEDVRDTRPDYSKSSVLICAKCNLVLADSLGVCGEVKYLKSIICLKITKDLTVRGRLQVCKDSPLAFCTYKVLECSGCRRFVGVVLHATPQQWSSLRNLFLLRKDTLNCYKLKSGTVVKATKMSFENRLLGQSLIEIKQHLESYLKQMKIMKNVLDESRIGQSGIPFSSVTTE
ncbi:protein Mis18-beta-like [Trichomycterus rosablanca]|uniref:protein Mis18-beta-like n=1 Tax=Trichomycterus rosablanca TaxID=2290929 RepID=UPI002F35CAD1